MKGVLPLSAVVHLGGETHAYIGLRLWGSSPTVKEGFDLIVRALLNSRATAPANLKSKVLQLM